MKRRKMMVLGLIGILTGCASPIVHDTPSKRPERQFANKPEDVKAALLSMLVSRNYQIHQESEGLVVALSWPDKSYANMFAPAPANPTVMIQSSFTLVPTNAGTRVIGDVAFVSKPGSGSDRVTPMPNSLLSRELQDLLNALVV
jgi:hypothetical protein